MMKQVLFVAVLWAWATLAVAAETTPTLKIVDRPLPADCWSARPAGAEVDTIMLHFCSDVLQNPDNPYQIDRIVEIFSQYKVSSHYLIDRDGTVYRFVDETAKAWHAGTGELPFDPPRKDVLNNHSIGIEMFAIGSQNDMKIFGIDEQRYNDLKTSHPEHIGFTDAQYAALNALIDDIMTRWPLIKRDRRHIVGHSDYSTGRKTDPGELFDWGRLGLPAAPPAKPRWNFFRHYANRLEDIEKAIAALPPETTGTVVLLGDSITEWHPAKTLGGLPVVNMGISGDHAWYPPETTGGVARRVPLVAKAKPSDIFLMIGINDLGASKSLDALERHHRIVIASLREQVPGARLHIQSILPTRDRFAFHLPNIREANRRLQRIAQEAGADYINLFDLMTDEQGELRADFTGDGLHLHRPAYEIWTAALEKHLAAQQERK
jgi:N-acetyl-anhydromuramyl-L-alanine amidase AmpD/lysophospholipase L1-like esterase